MMKQDNQASIYNCDQVSTYANATNPESSVVGCAFFLNMATDSSSLPAKFSFQENLYHYYVWYSSTGIAATSIWYLGESSPVGEQTDYNQHTKWFTDADCYAAVVGEMFNSSPVVIS